MQYATRGYKRAGDMGGGVKTHVLNAFITSYV